MAYFKRRLASFVILFLLFILPGTQAWEQLDHEIFDLVDQLTMNEGEEATFYSLLGIEPSATEKEIGRAYRKLSLALHPDKNPDEDSKEKFALLGSITAILRNSENRERYNFFLKNGVPKWRGTGWYYSRYRPGLTGVLTGLFVLCSFLHYLVMWVNFFQEKKRVRFFMNQARENAWGKRMKKQYTRKKVSVQDKQFIVDGDQVAFLTDEGEFVLSEDEVAKPGLGDLFPVLVYKKVLNKILIGLKKKSLKEKETSHDDKEPFSSDDERSEAGDNPKSRVRRRKLDRRIKPKH
ncbi:1830_t:CDS:2 [Diversispora eburnea]|uniref:1830_t:CDS:1 n=1 Tax=Diversispora eburnea TaxID=1213867 RepID=A0A9N8V949_9GLOM|nr:1830_t:CDS:2 [Diversispora eburnea]